MGNGDQARLDRNCRAIADIDKKSKGINSVNITVIFININNIILILILIVIVFN